MNGFKSGFLYSGILYSIPLTLQNRVGTAMNYLDKKLYIFFSITHAGYVTTFIQIHQLFTEIKCKFFL